MKIFDGHNDVLLRLWQRDAAAGPGHFLKGDGEGHLDLPRMRKGNLAGGFFAIFAPAEEETPHDDEDLNPPPMAAISRGWALPATLGMADLLIRIEAQSDGAVKICRSAADIRAALAADVLAVVMHIEGAEAIGADLSGLETLKAAGLRSIGPVWSRDNVFGSGVPFRFPSSPDTGPGLTPAGKEFVRECNRLKLMVDLSHLNQKGFWDVASTSTAPLVATHSNAHALSPSSRNLDDEQIKAIGQSGGMIGLNFATGFLRGDGMWNTQTGADVMIRHLDHMIRLAGEDCVGLGSDFDGARIPGFIGDATGLPNLIQAMEEAGFGKKLIAKLAHENWIRVLEKTWGG
jgi:membrane dipeptidase